MGHGLSTNTITKANKAVERVLTSQSSGEMTEKRKYTTAFTPNDHVFIGSWKMGMQWQSKRWRLHL